MKEEWRGLTEALRFHEAIGTKGDFLLTTEEAALYLNLKVRDLQDMRRAARRGRPHGGPQWCLIGSRKHRYSRYVLDQWLLEITGRNGAAEK